MKKILIGLSIILLSACSLGDMNTPKQIVSEFLDKYKNQDSSILTQLDETINNEYTNDDYRSRYKTLMTNQYKNLEYKLSDAVVEGNNAVVEAQVTVYDYASAIRNSSDYLNSNPDDKSNKFSTLASYIIVEGNYNSKDLSSISFNLVRVPYDIEKEIKDIEESDMPNKTIVIKSLRGAISASNNLN